MKIRFVIIASLGLMAGQLAAALAAGTPLPNYDQRKLPSAPIAPANVAQDQAAVLLQARVPNLRVNKDAHLGSLRRLIASKGFLTGAGGNGRGLSSTALAAVPVSDPHRVVKSFVNEHAALFGHNAGALAAARLKSDYVTAHSGLRTVIWQQSLDDIPVYGGLFVSCLTKNDELATVSDRFVPDLTAAANAVPNRSQLISVPPVSARAGLHQAAANLGEDLSVTSVADAEGAPSGAEQRQSFTSPRLRGPAYAQLVWLPVNGGQVKLCWQVILTSRVRPEMYLVLVSAQSGEVLLRRCLTADISPASYNVYTSDSPSPFSPGLATPSSFQPPLVPRTLVVTPALNTNASPLGWINDGVNETRGNNVDAHLDRNDDNQPDLPRPQGTPPRVFDFPLDLTQSPTTYGNASVVNLFYWNNFVHDQLYELGFTEAAGNFQLTNFNKGGLGGDAVQADAQDGGGFNNANFSTPPDGFPGRMQMYLFDGPNPDRDGDLDAEVMIHEYVHGLSNRLLGGGVGISNLQPAGMGEGWSDFYAISLLSEPTDDPHANYAAGGYLTYKFYGLNDNYYFGIRRYPYTTDMNKNPLTLKDIDPTQADAHAGIPISPVIGGSAADEVHAMGEVWCVTLWDARANLIDKFGPDLGNRTMLRLVTDGLKLAPANASFLEARDGILKADEILTGGDNLAELWYGFAKRGMGFSASVPDSDTDSTIGVVEAYDVPDYVTVGPPDGIMEIKITPPTASALFGGTTNPIYVRVTDNAPVTNATLTATLTPGGPLTFANNGVAPDLTANNAIYTANYATPNVTTNVILTVIITAPGKDPATNTVYYSIVPVPANDNFSNATKAAVSGAVYLTNNKRATTEPNEPAHAGVASSAASLWWNYTPTNNGSVLIDSAGSGINTIIAVYTNSTLATLSPVVSADDLGTRQQAFVFLNGKAGVTYRIAAASYDTNTTGTLRLAITPGGIPDTNAPTVAVTSPPSGLTVATNRVVFTGTAIDPDPNPSGLQEVQFRINRGASGGAGDAFGVSTVTASLISSNWTRTVGLFEGLNIIEVTVSDVAGNRSTPVVLQVTYRPLNPPNDFFVNAITLTGTNDVSTVNTTTASKEVGEPNHAGNPGGKSAWWNFTPPADGVLVLTTTNSTFDTLLGLYTGPAVASLAAVTSNDDAYDGVPGGFSSLTNAVRSNTVYRIAVDGYGGASGVVFLEYTFTPAPVYRLTINATSGGSTAPGSMDVSSNTTVSVTALAQPGYTFNLWDGDVVSVNNPVAVTMNGDRSLTAHFLPVGFTDGFESGNLTTLNWTGGGNQPWLVQNTNVAVGNYAARSGVIGASQTSSLILVGNFRAGVGSFDLRVSSELGWDVLTFRIDGATQQAWSGDVGWTSYGFPLAAGPHTLEWRYAKDANNTVGLDAAFLDDVNLPLVIAPNAAAPARLTPRRLTDGGLLIELAGQTNQLYLLQASTNLITWQTIATNVATGGFIQVVDPASTTLPLRFYRAVVPVP